MEEAIDLGRLLGRREAFGLIAGRCSAAEAQTLRQVRDSKRYLDVAANWEEFCQRHLGVHPRKVQRTLRLLEEFGPQYFHVAQMAHVTPDEYRAIAAHVGPDGVRVDGEPLALLPENSERVSAAVAELVRREKPRKERPAEPSAAEALLNRIEVAAEALASFDGKMDAAQTVRLADTLRRIATLAVARAVAT